MKMMGSTTSSRLQACLCLMIVAMAISWSGAVVDAKKFTKVEFYLHEQFVDEPGYEATDVLIASPSGNTSAYAFGNFGISEQVIREGVSNTSTIIGRAPGTFQPNKDGKSFALYKLLTLQTEKLNGTILVFCDWMAYELSNEWTIAGGTGMYRMARGYVINSLAAGSATSPSVIFKWEVYILNE